MFVRIQKTDNYYTSTKAANHLKTNIKNTKNSISTHQLNDTTFGANNKNTDTSDVINKSTSYPIDSHGRCYNENVRARNDFGYKTIWSNYAS